MLCRPSCADVQVVVPVLCTVGKCEISGVNVKNCITSLGFFGAKSYGLCTDDKLLCIIK